MKISKTDISKSRRLSNLEKKMTLEVALNKNEIPIGDLKERFYRKASLETTKAIVNVSDNFNIDANDFVSLAFTSNKYAIVEYKCTGKVKEIYIDGQSGDTSGDTISDVSVTPQDLFLLDVRANSNESWKFDTVTVVIVEDSIPRNRFGVNLNESGNFSKRV